MFKKLQALNASQIQVEEYNEPITQIADIPLRVKHTPARLGHDILTHNQSAKYTQIGVVGLPGSGKTTFVQCLLHNLHVKDDKYDIHWYKKEAILDLDKILDKLPKQQDAILVFDDVSYLFERLPSSKIAEILHSLTIVREKLDPVHKQTRIIVFLMFHYSFALVKGLRTTNFRVICSVSDEEYENYRKVLGYHNSKAIYEFTKKYMSMMRYQKFKIKSNNDEPFVYKTDAPFRLALVSNLGELHYTLYHPLECTKCRPKKNNQPVMPDVGFWEELLRKYGYHRVSQALAVFTFVNTHRPTVTNEFKAIWRQLQTEYRAGKIDLDSYVEIFKEAKKIKADTMPEQVQKKHDFIINHLKEKEKQAVEGQKKGIVDNSQNLPVEAFEGDESNIALPEREDFSDDDDNDIEAGMESDERAFKEGGY